MFGQTSHSSSTKRRGFDISSSSVAVRSRRLSALLDDEYGEILRRIENQTVRTTSYLASHRAALTHLTTRLTNVETELESLELQVTVESNSNIGNVDTVYALANSNQDTIGTVYALANSNQDTIGTVYALANSNQDTIGTVYALANSNQDTLGTVYALANSNQDTNSTIYALANSNQDTSATNTATINTVYSLANATQATLTTVSALASTNEEDIDDLQSQINDLEANAATTNLRITEEAEATTALVTQTSSDILDSRDTFKTTELETLFTTRNRDDRFDALRRFREGLVGNQSILQTATSGVNHQAFLKLGSKIFAFGNSTKLVREGARYRTIMQNTHKAAWFSKTFPPKVTRTVPIRRAIRTKIQNSRLVLKKASKIAGRLSAGLMWASLASDFLFPPPSLSDQLKPGEPVYENMFTDFQNRLNPRFEALENFVVSLAENLSEAIESVAKTVYAFPTYYQPSISSLYKARVLFSPYITHFFAYNVFAVDVVVSESYFPSGDFFEPKTFFLFIADGRIHKQVLRVRYLEGPSNASIEIVGRINQNDNVQLGVSFFSPGSTLELVWDSDLSTWGIMDFSNTQTQLVPAIVTVDMLYSAYLGKFLHTAIVRTVTSFSALGIEWTEDLIGKTYTRNRGFLLMFLWLEDPERLEAFILEPDSLTFPTSLYIPVMDSSLFDVISIFHTWRGYPPLYFQYHLRQRDILFTNLQRSLPAVIPKSTAVAYDLENETPSAFIQTVGTTLDPLKLHTRRSWSFSMWVKTGPSTTQTQYLIRGQDSPWRIYLVVQDEDNVQYVTNIFAEMTVQGDDFSTKAFFYPPLYTLRKANWNLHYHHLLFAYDVSAVSLTLYIDGEPQEMLRGWSDEVFRDTFQKGVSAKSLFDSIENQRRTLTAVKTELATSVDAAVDSYITSATTILTEGTDLYNESNGVTVSSFDTDGFAETHAKNLKDYYDGLQAQVFQLETEVGEWNDLVDSQWATILSGYTLTDSNYTIDVSYNGGTETAVFPEFELASFPYGTNVPWTIQKTEEEGDLATLTLALSDLETSINSLATTLGVETNGLATPHPLQNDPTFIKLLDALEQQETLEEDIATTTATIETLTLKEEAQSQVFGPDVNTVALQTLVANTASLSSLLGDYTDLTPAETELERRKAAASQALSLYRSFSTLTTLANSLQSSNDTVTSLNVTPDGLGEDSFAELAERLQGFEDSLATAQASYATLNATILASDIQTLYGATLAAVVTEAQAQGAIVSQSTIEGQVTTMFNLIRDRRALADQMLQQLQLYGDEVGPSMTRLETSGNALIWIERYEANQTTIAAEKASLQSVFETLRDLLFGASGDSEMEAVMRTVSIQYPLYYLWKSILDGGDFLAGYDKASRFFRWYSDMRSDRTYIRYFNEYGQDYTTPVSDANTAKQTNYFGFPDDYTLSLTPPAEYPDKAVATGDYTTIVEGSSYVSLGDILMTDYATANNSLNGWIVHQDLTLPPGATTGTHTYARFLRDSIDSIDLDPETLLAYRAMRKSYLPTLWKILRPLLEDPPSDPLEIFGYYHHTLMAKASIDAARAALTGTNYTTIASLSSTISILKRKIERTDAILRLHSFFIYKEGRATNLTFGYGLHSFHDVALWVDQVLDEEGAKAVFNHRQNGNLLLHPTPPALWYPALAENVEQKRLVDRVGEGAPIFPGRGCIVKSIRWATEAPPPLSNPSVPVKGFGLASATGLTGFRQTFDAADPFLVFDDEVGFTLSFWFNARGVGTIFVDPTKGILVEMLIDGRIHLQVPDLDWSYTINANYTFSQPIDFVTQPYTGWGAEGQNHLCISWQQVKPFMAASSRTDGLLHRFPMIGRSSVATSFGTDVTGRTDTSFPVSGYSSSENIIYPDPELRVYVDGIEIMVDSGIPESYLAYKPLAWFERFTEKAPTLEPFGHHPGGFQNGRPASLPYGIDEACGAASDASGLALGSDAIGVIDFAFLTPPLTTYEEFNLLFNQGNTPDLRDIDAIQSSLKHWYVPAWRSTDTPTLYAVRDLVGEGPLFVPTKTATLQWLPYIHIENPDDVRDTPALITTPYAEALAEPTYTQVDKTTLFANGSTTDPLTLTPLTSLSYTLTGTLGSDPFDASNQEFQTTRARAGALYFTPDLTGTTTTTYLMVDEGATILQSNFGLIVSNATKAAMTEWMDRFQSEGNVQMGLGFRTQNLSSSSYFSSIWTAYSLSSASLASSLTSLFDVGTATSLLREDGRSDVTFKALDFVEMEAWDFSYNATSVDGVDSQVTSFVTAFTTFEGSDAGLDGKVGLHITLKDLWLFLTSSIAAASWTTLHTTAHHIRISLGDFPLSFQDSVPVNLTSLAAPSASINGSAIHLASLLSKLALLDTVFHKTIFSFDLSVLVQSLPSTITHAPHLVYRQASSARSAQRRGVLAGSEAGDVYRLRDCLVGSIDATTFATFEDRASIQAKASQVFSALGAKCTVGVEHLELDAVFTSTNGTHTVLEDSSLPDLSAIGSASSDLQATSMGHVFTGAAPVTRDGPPQDVLYISADALLGTDEEFEAWLAEIVSAYVPDAVYENYLANAGFGINPFAISDFEEPKDPVPLIYVTNPKRIDVWDAANQLFSSTHYAARSTYDEDGQVVRNKNLSTESVYFTRMATLRANGKFGNLATGFGTYLYYDVQQSFTDSLLSYNFFTADTTALTTDVLRDLDFRKAIGGTEVLMNDSDGQVTNLTYFNGTNFLRLYLEFSYDTTLDHTLIAFGDLYALPYVFAFGINTSDQPVLYTRADGATVTTLLTASTVTKETWHSLYILVQKVTDFIDAEGVDIYKHDVTVTLDGTTYTTVSAGRYNEEPDEGLSKGVVVLGQRPSAPIADVGSGYSTYEENAYFAGSLRNLAIGSADVNTDTMTFTPSEAFDKFIIRFDDAFVEAEVQEVSDGAEGTTETTVWSLIGDSANDTTTNDGVTSMLLTNVTLSQASSTIPQNSLSNVAINGVQSMLENVLEFSFSRYFTHPEMRVSAPPGGYSGQALKDSIDTFETFWTAIQEVKDEKQAAFDAEKPLGVTEQFTVGLSVGLDLDAAAYLTSDEVDAAYGDDPYPSAEHVNILLAHDPRASSTTVRRTTSETGVATLLTSVLPALSDTFKAKVNFIFPTAACRGFSSIATFPTFPTSDSNGNLSITSGSMTPPGFFDPTLNTAFDQGYAVPPGLVPHNDLALTNPRKTQVESDGTITVLCDSTGPFTLSSVVYNQEVTTYVPPSLVATYLRPALSSLYNGAGVFCIDWDLPPTSPDSARAVWRLMFQTQE